MLNDFIKQRFLTALEKLEYGTLDLTTPEGKTYWFEGKQPGYAVQLTLHDWKVISRMLLWGDVALAEDYRDGLWDTEDLPNLISSSLQNEAALDSYIHGNWLTVLMTRVRYLLQKNSIKGSERNIHAHYDIGNDFYKLWLDPSMTYSSALYNNAEEPLSQAQYNKYDRITERLGSNSGKLVEIGCGWGGFAERALQHNDYDITGLTISQEQYDYATKRLENNASIRMQDYRKHEGKYDHIVSIEMFEAVGEQFWPTYFNKVSSLLNQSGKAVIQTITIHDDMFERYRRGSDMIRSFIFPGGMLPSEQRFAAAAGQADLKVTDTHHFGQDYARTLTQWLEQFDAKIDAVRQLGFDDKFIRLWRMYLSACIAGFRTGRTDVMQVELQHA